MLLRIAPEMFVNDKFDCITLPEVKREITQTSKFKDRYSWRIKYKNKLKTIGMTEYDDEDFKLVNDTIKELLNACTINKSSGKIFDLSSEDIIVASYSVYRQCRITTGDKNLSEFVKQEFEIINYSALEVLNIWIKNKLITVDSKILSLIEEWKLMEEPPQPSHAIREFEKLTKLKYLGP
jgi:hypothetical protein